MRRLLLVPSFLLLLPAGCPGWCGCGRCRHICGVSASLYSTFKDDKRIIPARDELSAFVASGGVIRGAYVESALEQARKDNPGLQASDEELANALLSGMIP